MYSPRTGILLNNELLDLCWRHSQGSRATPRPGEHSPPPAPAPAEGRRAGLETERAALGGWLESESALTPVWLPVPGERPPSSMVPSILVSTARGSKLVIGGAGGELIISAVAQVSLGTPGWNAPLLGGPAVPRGVGEGGWYPHSPAFLPASSSSLQAIMNKLWLGFDLQAAINAPILHVDSKGQVEFEPSFSQVRQTPPCLPSEPGGGGLSSCMPWARSPRISRVSVKGHRRASVGTSLPGRALGPSDTNTWALTHRLRPEP